MIRFTQLTLQRLQPAAQGVDLLQQGVRHVDQIHVRSEEHTSELQSP